MAIVWHEVALGAVTLLFLSSRTCMGCVVAVNGVLCHGAMALNHTHKHHQAHPPLQHNVLHTL